jgi:hypothetical protein
MTLRRPRQKLTSLRVETSQLQARGSHPFCRRLIQILHRANFDSCLQRICGKYCAPTMGRPSIAPGVYFRCFLAGCFSFWAGALGVDATTLEANAALKSIVRRDKGASYNEHVMQLMQLMKTEGIEEPAPAPRQRFDRKRKESLSNRDWGNPHDPEARITKMKDGRTHLACQSDHAVDLDTGALVALTVQPAGRGDTVSMTATLAEAGSTVMEMAGQAADCLAALCFWLFRLMPAANSAALVIGPRWPTARTANPHCHHQSAHRQDAALSTGC